MREVHYTLHCSALFYRYSREESFTTLNIDIRNQQNMLESLEQYVKACEKVASDLRLGIGVYQILQFLPSPTNWLKSQFSSNVAQK